MTPLVVVTHPRRIPECVDAFAALTTPVAYISGYRMLDVPPVMARLVEETDHDPILVCADDCVVTQFAVDSVLDLLDQGHPVVTGWCNLDRTHPQVNLSRRPLRGDRPHVDAYDFPTFGEVADHDHAAYPTHFVGMSLTGMSRAMWQRFPLTVFTNGHQAWASDFNLSMRLRDAGIPMVAARDGWVDHVKETWNRPDRNPEKRLLVGEIPAEVIWQAAPEAVA